MTACSAENGKERLGRPFSSSLMRDHYFTGSETEPGTFSWIIYQAANGGEQL